MDQLSTLIHIPSPSGPWEWRNCPECKELQRFATTPSPGVFYGGTHELCANCVEKKARPERVQARLRSLLNPRQRARWDHSERDNGAVTRILNMLRLEGVVGCRGEQALAQVAHAAVDLCVHLRAKPEGFFRVQSLPDLHAEHRASMGKHTDHEEAPKDPWLTASRFRGLLILWGVREGLEAINGKTFFFQAAKNTFWERGESLRPTVILYPPGPLRSAFGETTIEV
jgi:hypothetical protein